MKINIFLKKLRIGNFALIFMCVLAFSSCLKDKAPGNQDYSKSPALVSFQYTGGAATPIVAAIPGTAEDSLSVEVTLSVSTQTISTPVTVTIVPSDAALDSFNTAGGNAYVQLDPTLYSLQNGGSVTISPGQQIVKMKISFAGDKIDFTQQNAIGLQLTNANGATIATNLSTAIIIVSLKNAFEGNYHVSGNRHHPTLGDFPFDYTTYMSTVDGVTIIGNADFDFQTPLQIHINPDNTVTLSDPSAAFVLFLQAGKENDYNPATKTFVLNFYYNTGAPRLISETLVAD